MHKPSIILAMALIVILMVPSILAGNSSFTDMHQINIVNLFISDASLKCNKNLYAAIEFKNAGTENEYVHMELVNEKLGIDEFAPIVMIQPNKHDSVTIPVTLKQEPEGNVEFEVLAYFNNEIRRYFQSFTFKGCPDAPKTDSAVDPALFTQSSSESKEKALQGLSMHTWYVIIMIILIFLLVLIYVLKLYIQSITQKK